MDILIYDSPHANHLQWCLESIKTHSPNSKVHTFLEKYQPCKMVEEFKKIYFHSSNNPRSDVVRSLIRWIVMLEYCHANNITEFFTCDSDILLFCDIDSEVPNLPMAGHTGCAFIRNLATLNKFVQSIFEFYEKKKWRFYESHSNVSDMTVWDEFFETRDTGTMFHLKNPMWDANIGLPQGLEMKDGRKRIWFLDGIPFGGQPPHATATRLLNIHCWGSQIKPRMQEIWQFSQSTIGTNEPKEFV